MVLGAKQHSTTSLLLSSLPSILIVSLYWQAAVLSCPCNRPVSVVCAWLNDAVMQSQIPYSFRPPSVTLVWHTLHAASKQSIVCAGVPASLAVSAVYMRLAHNAGFPCHMPVEICTCTQLSDNIVSSGWVGWSVSPGRFVRNALCRVIWVPLLLCVCVFAQTPSVC